MLVLVLPFRNVEVLDGASPAPRSVKKLKLSNGIAARMPERDDADAESDGIPHLRETIPPHVAREQVWHESLSNVIQVTSRGLNLTDRSGMRDSVSRITETGL